VVIALSGACGSEPHAGGNVPEFTDGRYRRRNLPFNGTTADDEVAPIQVVRRTATTHPDLTKAAIPWSRAIKRWVNFGAYRQSLDRAAMC